jgi:glycosyltransferase involved in cell wall biosynthesis
LPLFWVLLMNDFFSLDGSYSTTRQLSSKQSYAKSSLYLPDVLQGGLRLKDKFKSSKECNPLITIITVVYNGGEYIENTIRSIIFQDYNNVEYIIIDGGSTDETLNIIRKYEDAIDYWVSCKDDGVYDAMNKGISLSSGKWINFMNAGDSFFNLHVLSDVKDFLSDENSVIYGAKITNNNIELPKPLTSLKNGEIFACHQSMFFNFDKIGKCLNYDLTYKIYADYELLVRIDLMGGSFREINLIISDYADGGISSVVSSQKRKDKYRAVYKHYGLTTLVLALFHRAFGVKK